MGEGIWVRYIGDRSASIEEHEKEIAKIDSELYDKQFEMELEVEEKLAGDTGLAGITEEDKEERREKHRKRQEETREKHVAAVEYLKRNVKTIKDPFKTPRERGFTVVFEKDVPQEVHVDLANHLVSFKPPVFQYCDPPEGAK
jgi:hypothetical protein